MKRLHVLTGIAVLMLLSATVGCYTVLRHPVAESVTYEGTYYRSCADCHADAAYYHPYYRYGTSHTRWQGYYGYPWWYDDYWWYPHEDTGEPRDVERGERHLWSPGGWASGGWGFTKGTGTAPPPTVRPPDDQEKEEPEEKTPDDEKSDQDDRHLWTKPKKGF